MNEPLKTLGAYRLLRALGAGGMATVYEAEHLGLQKRVAVKVLRPELAASADMRARFLREGVAASRIRHPHVVDITDVGEHDGTPYLVMELLEGESLADVIERATKLPVRRAVDIILPVIAALGDAHRAGVIHRDLKPDNLFLARNAQGQAVPKLLDFGISRLFGRSAAQLTTRSQVLGTPDFMSPEQARGEEKVGPASDQFSLAVVLYECLTGELPHPPDTSIVRVLRAVAFGAVIPPSAHEPIFDPQLEAVLMRALSPRPEDRFAAIEDLGRALLPFASARGRAAFTALTAHDDPGLPEPVSGGIFLPNPSARTPRHGSLYPEASRPTVEHGAPSHPAPDPPDPIDGRATTVRPAPLLALDVAEPSAPTSPLPSAPPRGAPTFARAAGWAMLAVAATLVSVLAIIVAVRLTPMRADPSLVITPTTVMPSLAPTSAPIAPGAVPIDEVVIQASPASAVIELDGVPVAVGAYRGAAPAGEALITVHAPGFVRRQFLLRGPVHREISLRAE